MPGIKCDAVCDQVCNECGRAKGASAHQYFLPEEHEEGSVLNFSVAPKYTNDLFMSRVFLERMWFCRRTVGMWS